MWQQQKQITSTCVVRPPRLRAAYGKLSAAGSVVTASSESFHEDESKIERGCAEGTHAWRCVVISCSWSNWKEICFSACANMTRLQLECCCCCFPTYFALNYALPKANADNITKECSGFLRCTCCCCYECCIFVVVVLFLHCTKMKRTCRHTVGANKWINVPQLIKTSHDVGGDGRCRNLQATHTHKHTQIRIIIMKKTKRC